MYFCLTGKLFTFLSLLLSTNHYCCLELPAAWLLPSPWQLQFRFQISTTENLDGHRRIMCSVLFLECEMQLSTFGIMKKRLFQLVLKWFLLVKAVYLITSPAWVQWFYSMQLVYLHYKSLCGPLNGLHWIWYNYKVTPRFCLTHYIHTHYIHTYNAL